MNVWLNFGNAHWFNASGASGGLFVAWQDNFHFDVLLSSASLIHGIVTDLVTMNVWLLSCVYGPVVQTTKIELWRSMKLLQTEPPLPWLCFGDFNDILKPSEKWGGRRVTWSKIKHFRKMVDECGFSDVPLKGGKFTWHNGQMGLGRIKEKLDRVLANEQWWASFPNAWAQLQTCTESDHNPISLNLHHRGNHKKRGFKFENMWIEHPSFKDTVAQAWEHSSQGSHSFLLTKKLEASATVLTRWNREVFGFVPTHLEEIRQELLNLQQKEGTMSTQELLRNQIREKELRARHRWLLRAWEKHWKQKSRQHWLREGDLNTRFFHLSTIKRRTRNRIVQLKTPDGEWTMEPMAIANMFKDHFNDIFSSNPTINQLDLINNLQSTLEPTDVQELLQPLSSEEIKNAVFSINPDSSPGADGFTARFFQNCWDLVSTDITNMVNQFFDQGTFHLAMNHTLLALIPKKTNPLRPEDFRPISLCNTTYKIITKILIARIRPLLDKLVSQHQSAFIPGRSIHDNIFLAKEVLHYIKHTRPGKTGGFALKVDIQKAYDSLEWSFIENTLRKFGFPEKWIQMIMFCVTTTTTAVLVNGQAHPLHKPTRGLRQGDPLSPYIFILCAQVLSDNILLLQRQNKFKGLKLSRYGSTITHLLFADDILICGRTNPKECRALKDKLNDFSLASGLHISNQKSEWMHHGKLNPQHRREVSAILGFKHTTQIKKYLGISLQHSQFRNCNYVDLITKFSNRLARWKSNTLNQAGRSLLIKTVIAGLPTHTMFNMELPAATTRRMERIQRNFFWGHDEQSRKLHTIAWGQIQSSTQVGGLNIRNFTTTNHALLTKRAWFLHTASDHWITKIFQQKYYPNGNFLQAVAKAHHSGQWKQILATRTTLQKGLQWVIEDGTSIPICDLRWLQPQFRSVTLDWHLLSPVKKLADWIVNNAWDLLKIREEGGECLIPFLLATPIGGNQGQDRLVWGMEKKGRFTVRSAVNLIANEPDDTSFPWRKIWKLDCAPKIKMFTWKLLHDGIQTSNTLCRMGPQWFHSCVMCHMQGMETADHLFFQCPFARDLWDTHSVGFTNLIPRTGTAQEIFRSFLAHRWESTKQAVTNRSLFVYIIWHIWLARNAQIFENSRQHPRTTLLLATQASREFLRETKFKTQGSHLHKQDPQREIKWRFPPSGWMKINTDGASKGNPGWAGAGAIIRDDQGQMVRAVAKPLGITTALMAEAWGLLEGIQQARQWRNTPIWIEMDSKCLVQLLATKPSEWPWKLQTLATRIMDALSLFPIVKISHIYREGNRVADVLANIATILSSNGVEELQSWEASAPQVVNSLLLADSCNVIHFR